MFNIKDFYPPDFNKTMDLTSPKKLHIVGIGGSGMKAIAVLLKEMGHQITGSDIKQSYATQFLEHLGIKIAYEHIAENVKNKDGLIYSTAIKKNNPELLAAKSLGITSVHRSVILAQLSLLKKTISVAGTHGKTSISSMITLVLMRKNFEPSYLIGGELNDISSSSAYRSGEYLVLEADESDGTFLLLKNYLSVICAIEPDHLSHWGNFENLKKGFNEFLKNSKSGVVFQDVKSLLNSKTKMRLVGFDKDCDYKISSIVFNRNSSCYRLNTPNGSTDVLLNIPGIISVKNSAMAIAALCEIGIDPQVSASQLRYFSGVARRFEHRGTLNGITFIDDYAHLPTEVALTIEAAKNLEPNRIICVFQPHRYTRTKDLYKDFKNSFNNADIVIITEIYPANEDPIPGITGELIYLVLRQELKEKCFYVSSKDELLNLLMKLLAPGDLLLTLGAGDITTVPDLIKQQMISSGGLND
jgi:UDP-N-acetylmuramate--alanine ligase